MDKLKHITLYSAVEKVALSAFALFSLAVISEM